MEQLLDQTAAVVAAEDEDKDPFQLLPEEIIVSHILNRISEAKYLFSISLVSKRFSHLVFQVHAVSVQIPVGFSVAPKGFEDFKASLRHQSFVASSRVFNIILGIPRALPLPILNRSPPSPSASAPPSVEIGLFMAQVAKFIAKLTSMRSLCWEYEYPRTLVLNNLPVFKWKICSESGALMFISAWSFDDIDTRGVDINEYLFDGLEFLSPVVVVPVFTALACQLPIAGNWLSLVENLVPTLAESLQNVLITDTQKQSKIVVGEKELVELRKQNRRHSGWTGARVRFGHAEVLELPLSGHVMKNVTLYLIRDKVSPGKEKDDSMVAKQIFNGADEEVFAEAAIAMLEGGFTLVF